MRTYLQEPKVGYGELIIIAIILWGAYHGALVVINNGYLDEMDFSDPIVINYFLAYAQHYDSVHYYHESLIEQCLAENSNYCFYIPYSTLPQDDIDDSFCTEQIIYMENGTLCRIDPFNQKAPMYSEKFLGDGMIEVCRYGECTTYFPRVNYTQFDSINATNIDVEKILCPHPEFPRYWEPTHTCQRENFLIFPLNLTSNFSEVDNSTESVWDEEEINLNIEFYSEDGDTLDVPIVVNPTEFSTGHEKDEPKDFGIIGAMILAVAIISIIAISAKKRLSIKP